MTNTLMRDTVTTGVHTPLQREIFLYVIARTSNTVQKPVVLLIKKPRGEDLRPEYWKWDVPSKQVSPDQESFANAYREFLEQMAPTQARDDLNASLSQNEKAFSISDGHATHFALTVKNAEEFEERLGLHLMNAENRFTYNPSQKVLGYGWANTEDVIKRDNMSRFMEGMTPITNDYPNFVLETPFATNLTKVLRMNEFLESERLRYLEPFDIHHNQLIG